LSKGKVSRNRGRFPPSGHRRLEKGSFCVYKGKSGHATKQRVAKHPIWRVSFTPSSRKGDSLCYQTAIHSGAARKGKSPFVRGNMRGPKPFSRIKARGNEKKLSWGRQWDWFGLLWGRPLLKHPSRRHAINSFGGHLKLPAREIPSRFPPSGTKGKWEKTPFQIAYRAGIKGVHRAKNFVTDGIF